MGETRLCLMLLGIIAIVGLLLSRNLYDFDLSLYRKWGWNTLADTLDSIKKWWLLMSRVILSAIAIWVFIALILL